MQQEQHLDLLQKIDFVMYLVNQGENRKAYIELLALKETLIEDQEVLEATKEIASELVNLDRGEV